jgi:spermidine/putrescine transport system permease protein
MRLGRRALGVWCAVVLTYLLAPIAVMVAFSLNEPAGRFNIVWRRFSLGAWRHPFAVPALAQSLALSLRIAVVAAALAAAGGAALAIALVRWRPRGSGAIDLLVLLPLAMPDVVLGASLLALFLRLAVPTGLVTIVATHVMIGLTYSTVTMKARLRGLDPAVEDAAMDLGAPPRRALRTVTLPLAAPAILAGALMAFALSLDDFTVTLFVAGPRVTFPLYVWGAARVAVPPQINVLQTMMLGGALLVALTAVAVRRR